MDFPRNKSEFLNFLAAFSRATYNIIASICGILVFNMLQAGVDFLLVMGIGLAALIILTAFYICVDKFDSWVIKRTAG
tara:strand:+ start:752 stop:985 length:234 start_codon:yes stop_codon:yes gene_type:complete